MKVGKLVAILVLVAVTFSMVGCYGSFTLTKKVYQFNGQLGNKWVNSIAMYLGGFVYEGAAFIDVCLLNVIEFWTGANPLAMNDGQMEKQIIARDGKKFEVTVTQNRLNVRQLDGDKAGQSVALVFSPTTGEWTMESGNQTVTVAKVTGSQLKMVAPDGTTKDMN
jgi:hypothetical protein